MKKSAKADGGELEILAFASRRGWEGWLARRHVDTRGVWVKFAKKGAG